MFGIILSLGLLFFGLFLKKTDNPGFKNSKRFAWYFIILGIITVVGKLTLFFLQKH